MLAAVLALSASACGVRSVEEQILADFFAAAQLHDTSALSRVATVDFNPRTQGVVQDFAVTGVEVTSSDADREVRQVTLLAQVRRSDGGIVPTTLVATLQRQDAAWQLTALRPSPEATPR